MRLLRGFEYGHLKISRFTLAGYDIAYLHGIIINLKGGPQEKLGLAQLGAEG
jgi:hypothetical protein